MEYKGQRINCAERSVHGAASGVNDTHPATSGLIQDVTHPWGKPAAATKTTLAATTVVWWRMHTFLINAN